MRLLLLFCLLVNLFLLSSCKKYQAANSSFFIKSDVISVTTASASEGSGSHKITDLWLYVNGKYQGTYPVGSLMPIANKDQATTINVFAGIKNNGISDTRIFYPFYQFLTLDTFVTAGKTISRSFSFNYKPNTQFLWMENFENSVGYSLKTSDNNVGTLQYASAGDNFEGKSILASLTGSQNYARFESTGSGFELKTGVSDIFLELNYKSNVAFTVGLADLAGTQEAEAVVVNPQASWNKIYIQLASSVNAITANKYKVYFKFVKTDDIDKQVFIDNVKLLYLP
ncbi:hypothetical protein CNR22_00885 [Sphingobacteriaceae bacterium]|nr:hypothetical protein CNR22_00885 [Sphingobacteriaceae bacterium]